MYVYIHALKKIKEKKTTSDYHYFLHGAVHSISTLASK